MSALSSIIAAVLASAASPQALALQALERAAESGDRVLVEAVSQPQPGCTVDRADVQPLRAGGRVAVRFEGIDAYGRSCSRAVFAQVRLLRTSARLVRPVATGASITNEDLTWEEVDVRAGRPPLRSLPSGATAARALPAGTVLEAGHLRLGPAPGTKVSVVFSSGTLTVEREGRVVGCGAEETCAVMENGKRVSGDVHDGKLWVVR